MTWLLIGVLVWIALGLTVALVLGKAIRKSEKEHDAVETQALAELDDDREQPEVVPIERKAPHVVPADRGTPPVVPTQEPAEEPKLPWTGPSTRPFPPPPSVPRRRGHLMPDHGPRTARDPSQQDSGPLT